MLVRLLVPVALLVAVVRQSLTALRIYSYWGHMPFPFITGFLSVISQESLRNLLLCPLVSAGRRTVTVARS